MDYNEIRGARRRVADAQRPQEGDAQVQLEFARRLLVLLRDSYEPGIDEVVPIDRIREAILDTLREDLPGWMVAQACISEGVDLDLVLHVPEP